MISASSSPRLHRTGGRRRANILPRRDAGPAADRASCGSSRSSSSCPRREKSVRGRGSWPAGCAMRDCARGIRRSSRRRSARPPPARSTCGSRSDSCCMKCSEPGWRGTLLSLFSGILLALAYPLADLGSVAFVALVPLLLATAGASREAALRRGLVCGAAFFVLLLAWIPRVMVVYGGLSRPVAWIIFALLVGYLSIYVALFAWAVAGTWQRYGPGSLLAAPIFWVGLELARAHLLTGFPWGLLGYSQ